MSKIESPSQEKEKYSAAFVEKVKQEFPDWTDIHKALDSGSQMVGRYLDDARGFSMNPTAIVKAIESGKQEDVLKAAKRADTIEKLYTEWAKEAGY